MNNILPDIFPYKIKNRNAFYDRDHDKVDVLYHKDYWIKQLRKSIEGRWVFDKGSNDSGAWVWMPPKLCFYIDIGIIEITNEYDSRVPGSPTMTDREMILSTYQICGLGYSGFTGDEFHTCNLLVEKIEQGKKLKRIEQNQLDADKYCFDKHGKLKKYVRSWDYLRETYLLKSPQGMPMGNAVYGNEKKDLFIFGSRGSAKTSYFTITGPVHEIYTGGIKNWEEAKNIGVAPLKIGIGSADSTKVEGVGAVMTLFEKNMPGGISNASYSIPPPLYREHIGSFGDHVIFRYQEAGTNISKGSGTEVKFNVYRPQSLGIFVGNRWWCILEDEVGMNSNTNKVRKLEDASMRDTIKDVKIGYAIRLGTPGQIKLIEECQKTFYNPEKNNYYAIPNYWEKKEQMIGLFLAAVYNSDKHKDDQGNTYIQESYEAQEDKLQDLIRLGADAADIRDHQLVNCNWPSQMFVDGYTSILPSMLAKRRKIKLTEERKEREVRKIGRLERIFDKVEFIEDNELTVIDYYTPKTTSHEKNTGASMYEAPVKNARPGLYISGYDTVRSDGYGLTDDASLCAFVVYKRYDPVSGGKQNTIVYTHVFRKMSLKENHAIVVMGCDFYGCQVLHETNVGDFTGYCVSRNRLDVMAPTPRTGNNIKLTGNVVYNVGIEMMDPELKLTALGYYSEWLQTKVGSNIETGEAIYNIDNIDDERALDEIAQFNDGNFDLTSAMLMIMLVLWSEQVVVYDDKEEVAKVNGMRQLYQMAMELQGNYANQDGTYPRY